MSLRYLIKGALVEYGAGLVSVVPNIVVFQFNPEQITRTLMIPPRPHGAALREVNQAGDIPVEQITFVANFSAHESTARTNPLTVAVGIGPQLAALEKMIRPSGPLTGLLEEVVDKVASKLKGGDTKASQSIPREAYPRLLFIWGATRVLPVTIDQMSIVEKQYDPLLNPTLAEVSITLSAIIPDPCSDDRVAKGAYQYSAYARDALALLNPAATTLEAMDLVEF